MKAVRKLIYEYAFSEEETELIRDALSMRADDLYEYAKTLDPSTVKYEEVKQHYDECSSLRDELEAKFVRTIY